MESLEIFKGETVKNMWFNYNNQLLVILFESGKKLYVDSAIENLFNADNNLVVKHFLKVDKGQ